MTDDILIPSTDAYFDLGASALPLPEEREAAEVKNNSRVCLSTVPYPDQGALAHDSDTQTPSESYKLLLTSIVYFYNQCRSCLEVNQVVGMYPGASFVRSWSEGEGRRGCIGC